MKVVSAFYKRQGFENYDIELTREAYFNMVNGSDLVFKISNQNPKTLIHENQILPNINFVSAPLPQPDQNNLEVINTSNSLFSGAEKDEEQVRILPPDDLSSRVKIDGNVSVSAVDISQIKNSIIGTHGMTHNKFDKMNYKSQLKELEESKKLIEKIIKNKIYITSYPHGSFDKNTIEILTKSDYKWGACSKKGFNTSDTNNFLLHRSEIIASDKKIDLEHKIKGYYDYY